ncbi:MAG: VCBS repeat-containing protein [Bacteroidales bacterium]|nr:VCBS repeat-containing protein [Bacteroidales bacterium]
MRSDKHLFLLIILLFGWGFKLNAQTFTDIKAGLTGVAESSSGWINPDRDGDPDVLAVGEFFQQQNRKLSSKIYSNLRNDRFTAIQHPIPDFHRGDFDLADVDLDGIDDLVVMGELNTGKRMSRLFKATLQERFVAMSSNFEPLRDGSVRFRDYDDDGDPDLLMTGEDVNGRPRTLLYRNDREDGFKLTEDIFPGVRRGVGEWIDYNLDGRADIILTGISENGQPISVLFENTGDGFKRLEMGFVPLKNSFVSVADVDNDGDKDVLLMGEMVNGRLTTRLYRNDRALGFTEVLTPFVAVRSGFADWGDMDADGDMDLLISGESSKGPVSKVYRNDRRDGFTDIDADLIPLYMSDGEWGDYDLDGDLDIIISGMASDYTYHTRIYRNDGRPAAITAVAEEVSENIWNNQTVVPERAEPIYYFVYSSSYSDLKQTGKKGYYAFVSPVKRPKRAYQMEETYNLLFRQTYPTWPDIDQGNIITNGFATKAAADQSRATVIEAYKAKNFEIIEINW